jgi:hypothetical protein
VRVHLSFTAVVAVLIFSVAGVASAQDTAASTTISVSTGALNFDLSGTGTTAGFAVRGTRALTPHLALETGVLLARPRLQDGNRATLFVPEVHLQYHWRAGRFGPYVGGGIGFGHQNRAGSNITDVALSAAGGARAHVTDRLAVLGEFRLRGLEHDFAGTTAEVMGGLSFAIGR